LNYCWYAELLGKSIAVYQNHVKNFVFSYSVCLRSYHWPRKCFL